MITPSDTPSDPAGYAAVAVQGMDIQAPQADLSAAVSAAGAVEGAGVVYGHGPRQAQAAAMMDSPQGSPAMDVTAGFAGGGGESWPANPNPIPTAETPIQGSGDFTGTGTD